MGGIVQWLPTANLTIRMSGNSEVWRTSKSLILAALDRVNTGADGRLLIFAVDAFAFAPDTSHNHSEQRGYLQAFFEWLKGQR